MKILLTLLAILGLLPAAANAQCNGPSPLVTSATVHNVTTDGKLNFYQIAATVKNVGTGQPSNTLQFVDIYQRDEKLDAKGIPPLSPGATYTVLYTMKRSVEAGKDTSYLTFKLDPSCNTNQGTYAFVF